MFRFLSIAILIISVASCKDAPILVQAGLHNDGKNKILFTIETVYTVTSKKSGGGMTTRSGYTTCFLNAVDIKTGDIIKRKKIGDFNERIEFLGSAGGKAWFFSYDPGVGIHTRNPETLEIGTTSKDIVAKNSVLAKGITGQAYQSNIDSSGKFLFTTTKDGYNYLVDPITLQATKTGDRSNRRFYITDASTAGNSPINDSLDFYFSGGPRAVLEVVTKKFSKRSYDFFSHNGKDLIAKNLYYHQEPSKKYDNISFIQPEKLVNTNAACGEGRREPLLLDGNTVFIVSKSMLGNSYNWVVAGTRITNDGAGLLWKSEINGTEKVSGSDKELLHGSIADGKLLVVFENLMIAFDSKSGDVIWRKEIRKESD